MTEHPLLQTAMTLALTPARGVLAACWLALMVLGVRALPDLRATWQGDEGRYRTALLALSAWALALRLGLAPLTPEIRFRVLNAYDPTLGIEDIHKYGLGYPMLIDVLVAVFGAWPELPMTASAFVGALTVLPMAGLARRLSGSRSLGLWAAFALSVTPMMVWYGHVDTPFVPDAFATLLGLWALTRYADDPRASWLVVTVASLVTACQMRVEALMCLPQAVVLAALLPAFPWRRRAPWVALAVTGLLLVPHAFVVAQAALIESSNRDLTRDLLTRAVTVDHYVVFDRSLQSLALIVAIPLGLRNARVPLRLRLWMLGSLLLLGSLFSEMGPTSTAFSVVRYQLRSVPWAALLGGLGLSWVASLRHGRWLSGAMVLASLFGLRLATTPSVMGKEYAFFRAHLDEVEAPCTFVTWLYQPDLTLYPPVQLSTILGRDDRWIDVHDPLPTEGCVVYYRSASCSTHYDFRATPDVARAEACLAFEAAWELAPIAEGQMAPDPYGPMGPPVSRPDEALTMGFYRVVGPAREVSR